MILEYSLKVNQYINASNVYWVGEETNMNMKYVEQHMTSSESLYVLYRALPSFCFENGYTSTSFDGGTENVILGNMFRTEAEQQSDIKAILEAHDVYIMTNSPLSGRTVKLQNALQEAGFMELVNAPYNTVLYFFSDDIVHSKSSFTITAEETSTDKDTGICTASVSILSTGQAYLNNGFDQIYLCAQREGESDPCAVLSISDNNIAPGNERTYTLSFDWGNARSVDFYFIKAGAYTSADIGVPCAKLLRSAA